MGTRILFVTSAYLLVCALGFLGWVTRQANLLGWFVLLMAVAYGLAGPYLLISNLDTRKPVARERLDRTFWVILPGLIVNMYASPLEYCYLPAILSRSVWMQVAGLGLIVISLVLFSWARLTLKGQYSGRLQIIDGHQLVQHGPYRIIRHPAYGSFIILSLGMAIGYSSLIGLVAIPLLLVPGLVYRITVEERLLRAEFGEQYDDYARRTRHLIPSVW